MDGVFIMETPDQKMDDFFWSNPPIFWKYPYTISGLFDKPLKSGIPEPGTNQDFVAAIVADRGSKAKSWLQGAQNMHSKTYPLTYVPSVKLTIAAKNGCLGNIYSCIYFILGGFGPSFHGVPLLFVSRVRVDFCLMPMGSMARLEPKPLPRPTKLLRRGRQKQSPGGECRLSSSFFRDSFFSFLGKVKRVQKNSSGKFPNDKHLYIKLFERFGSGFFFLFGKFLWKFQKIFQTLTSKVACVFLA